MSALEKLFRKISAQDCPLPDFIRISDTTNNLIIETNMINVANEKPDSPVRSRICNAMASANLANVVFYSLYGSVRKGSDSCEGKAGNVDTN
jgi:hypothetical protein